MISFETKNLREINQNHGLLAHDLKIVSNKLDSFLELVKARGQNFYEVIDNEEEILLIERFAQAIRAAKKFDEMVILGIGGSALGAKCLQQALVSVKENFKMHVLDNIDPSLIRDLASQLNYKRTLFLVISKSGETLETLAQYFYFQKEVELRELKIADHFIFVTDRKNGLLQKIAQENPQIKTFVIPAKVGGRFSVLTAVGLLPVGLLGVDFRPLLKGARMMRDRFLSPDFAENLPFQLAAIQYLLGKKGKTMNVLMPYSQKLIGFADWWRQLLAESIGKNENTGLTPITSLGVTDQHSQIQLYNQGPNDKLFILLEVMDFGVNIPFVNPYPNNPVINFLKTSSFNQLMEVEKEATKAALIKNNRPVISLKIPQVDGENLGALLLLFQGATAFLGEFYEINAFDQPGVELGKRLTKQFLKNAPRYC
ncbi:MAG: glucose-6-phosphate isomerase, glucose-6-phosphate isomerase [Candidatus Peregrinibacteria bacterium GW2011_GWE2_39_6]|nr:MAG: glucose-6-phosphate isomerase, glucose-6-phosphate isomerase [Candidatus Peregrinibacteria bacterium GW2011_GWF2_39_17]KKR25853.1 MAG: glucose-6-phosphate isomerase, glucose-6-phosphate isomerase [Candidatus Peregrinibacteria bacterium GW2011_GWE2_39_6]HCW32328.1 glucose-6-phosphate isomerase [Candidatus Peregrinibacteria bacterium]